MAHASRVYGSPDRPVDPVALRAGPVRMLLDGGEIRYLKVGEVEIVRRVYVAVRDRNWGTIPGRITDLRQEVQEDSFRISFAMQHTAGEIDFRWQGTITGQASGRVRFEMRGRAKKGFPTNRTGICVLHALKTCVGRPCTVEHVDGTTTEGMFPELVAPHQPFENIRAIRQTVEEVSWSVRMEGETFEMEDQRNWSDGSFKTYCRPLKEKFPYALAEGEEVNQAVMVEVHAGPAAKEAHRSHEVELDLTAMPQGTWVPQIGLTVADGFGGLDARNLAALASLRPRHLRLDLSMADARWRDRVLSFAPNLTKLGVPLEVAIRLSDSAAEGLREFAALWRAMQLKVVRWIILPTHGVTTVAQVNAARDVLASIDEAALFAGGTDADFVLINRTHPPSEKLDAISFALNPQVHASDNLSLMENLESQAQVVQSAAKLSGDGAVVVSPITLRQRFNPEARSPQTPDTRQLPPSVDLRQMSLLAAAWTLGSLAGLSRADYLTYYETDGWRGVMQGSGSPAFPSLFPAEPGEIFPVYHLLKTVLSFDPEYWSAVPVPDPLALAALLLEKPGRQRLLIANLTAETRKLALSLPQPATLGRLDRDAVLSASRDPEFWLNSPSSAIPERALIELSEYAIAQVDWTVT